jgi:hypothetical protein
MRVGPRHGLQHEPARIAHATDARPHHLSGVRRREEQPQRAGARPDSPRALTGPPSTTTQWPVVMALGRLRSYAAGSRMLKRLP